MILMHEAAHAGTTVLLGGRFEGITLHRGIAVGVRVCVDDLSVRQILATLVAAPVAEAIVIASAVIWDPSQRGIWLFLLAVQWTGNGIPWPGVPNDGRRIWQLLRQGRGALAAAGTGWASGEGAAS